MVATLQHFASAWPILTVLAFLPLVGGAVLFILSVIRGYDDSNQQKVEEFRQGAFIVSCLAFLWSLLLLVGFDVRDPGMQFVEHRDWIPSFGVSYSLGLDGVSLWLVLLTTFLMPIVVVASPSVHSRTRGYLLNMLALETAMIGTLVALDGFVFYLFWEAMLFPMYFIIGIWGGERRIYATLKFVLYTVVGSLLMLVALLYVVWVHYEQTGMVTFLLEDLLRSSLTFREELWLFTAFALAFGIKVPIFPFHTWLPDAHVEAPTGGSVVLAGVLLKMGLYGFIRFAYPLFPRAGEYFGPWIGLLAVIGIVYGALVAWAQHDIKKLVAYSSVSHLGFCVLGFVSLTTLSATGSIYQMLNHGISTGALFLLVGVLYDRRHTRAISEYGGLAAKVPVFAFLFLVFTLSSIAVPLTNGFVGEFMILLGSFKTFPGLTVLALLGVVFGAVYMLTLYLRTMFGELDEAKNGNLTDVSRREFAMLLPLLVLVFVMGIFPKPFTDRIEPTVEHYLEALEQRGRMLKDFEMSAREGGADPQPLLVRGLGERHQSHDEESTL